MPEDSLWSKSRRILRDSSSGWRKTDSREKRKKPSSELWKKGFVETSQIDWRLSKQSSPNVTTSLMRQNVRKSCNLGRWRTRCCGEAWTSKSKWLKKKRHGKNRPRRLKYNSRKRSGSKRPRSGSKMPKNSSRKRSKKNWDVMKMRGRSWNARMTKRMHLRRSLNRKDWKRKSYSKCWERWKTSKNSTHMTGKTRGRSFRRTWNSRANLGSKDFLRKNKSAKRRRWCSSKSKKKGSKSLRRKKTRD